MPEQDKLLSGPGSLRCLFGRGRRLTGDAVHRLPVDNDSAAGKGDVAVRIKGGTAGDVDMSAGDDEVTVGINAVGIAVTHDDNDFSSGNFNGRPADRGLSPGINAVTPGFYAEGTAVDEHVSALNTLGGRDDKAASVNSDGGVGVDGAAELKYDEEQDGWYMGERLDSEAAVLDALVEAGAIER